MEVEALLLESLLELLRNLAINLQCRAVQGRSDQAGRGGKQGRCGKGEDDESTTMAVTRSCSLQPATASTYAWHDAVQKLNDVDLRAEASPDTAHFQTNDTRANDCQLLGHLSEGEGASGVHDAATLVVHRAWRQLGDL